MKTKTRLEIYPPPELLRRLEVWRSRQNPIPTRAEALRLMAERVLDLDGVPKEEVAVDSDV